MVETGKRGGRKLTAGEITLLSQIFASGVNFEVVRLHRGYHPDLTETQVEDIKGRSHAFQNDIYLVGDDWLDDLSKTNDIKILGTLVHEMAHVWQHQNDIKMGGIAIMDKYHREQADAYSEAVDSIEAILESGIKYFQRRYKNLSEESAVDSVKVAIPHTVRDYKDKLKKYEFHTVRVKEDKYNYMSEDVWDPVYQFGPQPQYKYQQLWSLPVGNTLLAGLNLTVQPKPGERLSDFIWQSPVIQKRYGTKENLKRYMAKAALDDSDEHRHAATDYNYMLQAPGKAHFLWLRVEAQAKLVEDYFYLTRGYDPRTVSSGSDYRTRPTLEFYKMMIPFLPGKQPKCD